MPGAPSSFLFLELDGLFGTCSVGTGFAAMYMSLNMFGLDMLGQEFCNHVSGSVALCFP